MINAIIAMQKTFKFLYHLIGTITSYSSTTGYIANVLVQTQRKLPKKIDNSYLSYGLPQYQRLSSYDNEYC